MKTEWSFVKALIKLVGQVLLLVVSAGLVSLLSKFQEVSASFTQNPSLENLVFLVVYGVLFLLRNWLKVNGVKLP
jgi:NhaP-type Na+/H+ or K+/H+ antiporter